MKKTLLLPIAVFLLAGCSPNKDTSVAPEGASLLGGEVVDLSYAYDSDTVFWPTAAGFEITPDFVGITPGGYYYSAYSFSMAEHGGTHLDAPVHFSDGGLTNDQLPLENLMGPAVVVDVQKQAAQDRDYLVSIADFKAWEADHGRLPDGIIILIRTGFGAFWPDRDKYMGTSERGADAVPKLHFPGIDPEAAGWLASERSIHAIGLDTPSIDRGQSSLFETHQILFKANIPAFENVANVDLLPAEGFTIIALPMKIKGGSGGPVRIVAILPES